jgi:branched-chain amino acid transport system substrate-binding protein
MMIDKKIKDVVDKITSSGVMSQTDYEKLLKTAHSDDDLDSKNQQHLSKIEQFLAEGKLILSQNESHSSSSKFDYPKSFWFKLTLLAFFVFTFVASIGYNLFSAYQQESIYIAVVGPMSEEAGQEMYKAAQLVVDDTNKQGGINGKKLELLVHDDQNNIQRSIEIAREIAKDERILAVIGHRISDTSRVAGPIYKDNQIPAVTATATSLSITTGNDWYFRVSFDNKLQADVTALYISEILKQKEVSIIRDESEYGRNLSTLFQEKWENHLVHKIKNIWSFDRETENLDEELENIVFAVNKAENVGVLFIAAPFKEAYLIIKKIKELGLNNPIVGGDTLTTGSFQALLKQQENSGQSIDFYGVHAISNFMFDIANEKAGRFQHDFFEKYGNTPNNEAAACYDAVGIVVEAITLLGTESDELSIQEQRHLVQQNLAGFNSAKNSFQGTTGQLFFDEHGNAIKPVTISLYENNQLIPSMLQLMPLYDNSQIPNLAEAINKRKILIDVPYDYSLVTYYKKLGLVYTGIDLKEIKNFDPNTLIYDLEFDIWFRFDKNAPIDAPVEDIEFLNAAEPIVLGKPIEEQKVKGYNYKRYHVQGKFRANYNFGPILLHHYGLGMSFRHRYLTKDTLMFVPDSLGMGLSDSPFIEQVKEHNLLELIKGWALYNASFFQDSLLVSSFGKPQVLESQGAFSNFSRFNMNIEIQKEKYSIRRHLSYTTAYYIALVAIIGLASYLFLEALGMMTLTSPLAWFLKVSLTILLLLSGEVLFINILLDLEMTKHLDWVEIGFSISWWFAFAWFINLAIFYFIWLPLERRAQRSVPSIAKIFVNLFFYVVAFLGVIGVVLGKPITSLLATSGLIAMIIGLAVKANISNIFSGIAINLEKSFRVGDRVKINALDEGHVIDMNWRTTRILTGDNCVVSIPNATAAEAIVKNYNYPDKKLCNSVSILVKIDHVPAYVKKIMIDVALSVEGIASSPPPFARFKGMADYAAQYNVVYFVNDYGIRQKVEEALWEKLWEALHNVGVNFVPPTYELNVAKYTVPYKFLTPQTILNKVDLFKGLPDSLKERLSELFQQRHFLAGMTLVKQGEINHRFYFIVEGVVGVHGQLQGANNLEIRRLGAGEYFGEASLLAERSCAYRYLAKTDLNVYTIDKKDFTLLTEQESEQLQESFNQYLVHKEAVRRSERIEEEEEGSEE